MLIGSSQVSTRTQRGEYYHSLLDDDARTLRDEDEVREAVHDYRTLTLLDHVGQHCERGRSGRVTVREDADVGALLPGDVERRMDRTFYLFAVEVDRTLRLREGATASEGGYYLSETERLGDEMWTYGNPSTSHRIGHYNRECGQNLRWDRRWVYARTVSKMR